MAHSDDPKSSKPRPSSRRTLRARDATEAAPKSTSAQMLPPPSENARVPASASLMSPPMPVAPSAPPHPPSEPKASPSQAAAPTSNGKSRRPRSFVDDGHGAVLVTGICGRLGRLVARVLHRDDRVVGIDRRAFVGKPKDIVHHQFDVRRKKTRDIFRAGGIRAVVHLGVMHDPRASDKEHHSWNVVGFQKVLDYLEEFEIPKLVVLSSANVYGPTPDNPQFLTEEAPLLGAQSFSAIRDLVEVDMLAQSFFWRNPRTETVILRPCHIVGGVRNAPSNYLRLDRPVTLMGYDPMIQVIHERDVVSAIVLALKPGIRGIFNLRGPGELPLSKLLAMRGKTPRVVPGPIAEALISQLWRYRLTSFPEPELDHIRYVCMVDDKRARETLGFAPKFSLEDALAAVDGVR